jgi:Tfp pilus assembly protein PilV
MVSSSRFSSHRAGQSEQGFALLITITLLSFLVLLLVSLAALTRVETQVASNSQQQAQARQNALMALNIAIGQLQKYAGPDQRVTAVADLAGDANGNRLVSSVTGTSTTPVAPANTSGIAPPSTSTVTHTAQNNGLVAVRFGTRYWTGVWGNYDAPADIYQQTPNAVLLNWLVSGNEDRTFTADVSGSSPTGKISASDGKTATYLPNLSVTALKSSTGATKTTTLSGTTSATAPTATDTITLSNGKTAVLLAGPNTVGSDLRKLEGLTNPERAGDRYIIAPLVAINAPQGAVPGLGANAAPALGHYAYWIGDEGVKARINLVDANASHTDTVNDALARARLVTAPRAGAEVTADVPFTGSLTDFATTAYATWSQTAASASKALAPDQFGFLDSTTLTTTTLGRHFNDFTTYSVGIEADSLNGGLRRDLTYYLEKNPPTSGAPNTLWNTTWTGTDGQTAGAGQGIIPSSYSPLMNTLATADKRVPRWDILRSFYTLPTTSVSGQANSLSGTSADMVNMQPATDTQVGITPVVVQMRLLFGVNADSNAKTLKVMASPIVVLANPYAVKLAVPSGLNFTLKADSRLTTGSGGSFDNRFRIGDANNKKEVFGSGGVLAGTVFNIPASEFPSGGIAPGQTVVFSVHTNALGAGATVTMKAGIPTSFTYAYVTYTNWTGTGSLQMRPWETGGNSTFLAEFTIPGSTQVIQQIGGLNPNRASSSYPNVFVNSSSPSDQALALYEWQYNAPGSLLPTGYTSAGIANTTLRPFADFNPRAGYFRVNNASYIAPPYTQFYASVSTATVVTDINKDIVTSRYWGRDWAAANGTTTKAIFFDIPRRTASELPVLSLGGLQHANLAAEDIPATAANIASEFGSSLTPPPNPGHQPAYPFGNSYASIFLPRSSARASRTDYFGENSSSAAAVRSYYDISYLLNAAIWDGYFLSSIPQSGATYDSLNPRLTLTSTATATNVRDGQKAAANLTVNGAFNINSTSVDAWKAVLAGMKNLPRLPALPTTAVNPNTATVFPRSLHQNTAAVSPPTGTGDDSYSGYRQLTDTELTTLATEIVKQVRLRGPFVSLAQFVNRALIDATADAANGLGQAGALQKAIDKAINASFSTAAVNNTSTDTSSAAITDKATIPAVDDAGASGSEANGRGTNSLFGETLPANTGIPTPLARSTAIPGWLTQADVLQAIAPVISPRSDTFTIRTYGQVVDPVNTATTVVLSRAWCEAVVQRLPDYIDSSNAAEASPASVKSLNQTFGRRFKIVSFRWLSANDI